MIKLIFIVFISLNTFLNAEIIEELRTTDIAIDEIEDCPSKKEYFKNESKLVICNTEYLGEKGLKFFYLNSEHKFLNERIIKCKERKKGKMKAYELFNQLSITGNEKINGYKKIVYACIEDVNTLFIKLKDLKFVNETIKINRTSKK